MVLTRKNFYTDLAIFNNDDAETLTEASISTVSSIAAASTSIVISGLTTRTFLQFITPNHSWKRFNR